MHSPSRILSLVALLAVLCLVGGPQPSLALDLPDPEKAIADPAMEKLAGYLFSQEFEKKGLRGQIPKFLPPTAADCVIVMRVTARLAPVIAYERPSMKLKVKVIQSSDLNAFCLPGGYMYVCSGLLDFIRSNHKGEVDENELAAVMGHEIAHAVLRHHLLYWQSLKDNKNVLSDPDMMRKVIMAGERGREFEADRYGALYVMRAGYQMSRAIRLFELMGLRAKEPPDSKDSENDDHPSHWRRARQLRDYMRQMQGLVALWDESLKAVSAQDYEQARVCLEVLKADFPDAASVRNNLGWIYYHLYEQTVPVARRPEQQVAYALVSDLGFTLRGASLGDAETLLDAQKEFEEALRLAPDLQAAYEGAGVCALATGDSTRAREVLTRGAAVAPQGAGVQNDLGVVADGQGNLETAAALYQKALQLNPNYVPALYNLARVYEKQGRNALARGLLERYLGLDTVGTWADEARKRIVRVGGTPPAVSGPAREGTIRGFAGIQLGDKVEAVITRLGSPAERDALQSGTEVLRYPSRGLEVWAARSGVKFIVITSARAGAVGQAAVGMTRTQVERLLGVPPLVRAGDDGTEILSYTSQGLNVGIRNAQVDSIMISGKP